MLTVSQKGRGPLLGKVIGRIPYRLALAGGWIDQPFVSRLNPRPPGSMVVVGIEPQVRFMDRSGMATGTRAVAHRLWKGRLPAGKPLDLVRQLYRVENRDKTEPSGSQDMIGLIYPGISRLDFDFSANGGVFPAHIESVNDTKIVTWLEKVIRVIPVAPRPEGYNPLGEKNLSPRWVRRLGESGAACFEAICGRDLKALGASMKECIACWAHLLPQTLRHPLIKIDLLGLLRAYQERYPGAMYSGCGGGYIFVASEEPVPGSFDIKVRTKRW